jgi:hypothetical protein
LVASTVAITNDGFSREPKSFANFPNFEFDNDKLKKQTWNFKRSIRDKAYDKDKINVMIVGNSHALDMFIALTQNEEFNSKYSARRQDSQLSCFIDKNTADYQTKMYLNSDIIIVSTRFGDGDCKARRKVDNFLKADADLDGLKELLQRAKSDGKKVVVFGNTVEFLKSRKETIADNILKEKGDFNSDSDGSKKNEIINQIENELFKNINTEKFKLNSIISSITRDAGSVYLDKYRYLCDSGAKKCSAFAPGGYKIFYDYGHMTIEGAKYFGDKVLESGFTTVLEK